MKNLIRMQENTFSLNYPTNNALLINWRLSSNAEILFINKTEHANWLQMCKNVYLVCNVYKF